jgi:hypothetical protein
VEAIVLRKLSLRKFLVVLVWFVALPATLRAQEEQPSVADAARQARKDKDKDKEKEKDKTAAPAKTVITEDNISASGGTTALSSSLAAPDLSAKPGSNDSPWAKLLATETVLDRLDSLDRTQLAQVVLKGDTSEFPGRHDWENKLFSAKVSYVTRSRQLIEGMKQILTDLESLRFQDQGKTAPDDPRLQELTQKATQIAQLTARTEAAFQAVVTEGETLARQEKHR